MAGVQRSNSDNKRAAHNSRRAIDSCFKGTTLDFEHNRDIPEHLFRDVVDFESCVGKLCKNLRRYFNLFHLGYAD